MKTCNCDYNVISLCIKMLTCGCEQISFLHRDFYLEWFKRVKRKVKKNKNGRVKFAPSDKSPLFLCSLQLNISSPVSLTCWS